MGSVFLALDLRSGEQVAIKLLLASATLARARIVGVSSAVLERATVRLTENEREAVASTPVEQGLDLARFHREALLLETLSHPRIVRYLAHDVAGEVPYLAMELLVGESLSDRLRRGPLSVAEALRVTLRTAEGLAEAHRHGVVHRDVKPSNVFLVHGEVEGVKLLDFGIARSAVPPKHLTASGTLVGTPGYMAPEQVLGRRDLTSRVDVWALGCVLYECLCGAPPFGAEDEISGLGRILSGPIPRARALRPEVSPTVDALLSRMLEREPSDRMPDASAVIAALNAMEEPADASRASAIPSARVSEEERRVRCLVLVRQSGHDVATLSELCETMGGRLLAVGDDAVVSFAGRGTSRELATRGARFALAARSVAAEARFDVMIASTEARHDATVLAALDRATEPAHPPASGVVCVDASAATVLRAQFELRASREGVVLVGERDRADIVPWARSSDELPLVGRAREMAVIEGALAECLDDGVARVTLLVAPPGMGKTRLVAEILRRARAARPTLRALIAQADVFEAESPFALAASVVRQGCGVSAAEAPEAQRAQIERSLRGVPVDDAARVAEFLAEVLDVGDAASASDAMRSARRDAVVMGDALRAAFSGWLGALCEVEPVVLVLEDVHWSSAASARLIDAALRLSHDRSLFVLATARPEVRERLPGLWAERGAQEIELATLNARPAEQLVRALLGDAPREVFDGLIARAGGNPLYLVELARAFARSGETSDLPDSLLGVIQSRFDTLGAGARRALRAASVFGMRFWRGAVVTMAGGADGAIDAWLGEAAGAGLIRANESAEVPGEQEYSFLHALMRDAVYASLTAEDKVLSHQLAAAFLEEKGWSNAAIVARHYELGAMPDRAVVWYRHGAQRALEGQALPLAAELSARGLAVATAPDVRAALLMIASDAAFLQNDLDRAVTAATEASALCETGSATWHLAASAVVSAAGQRGQNDVVERWALQSMAARATAIDAVQARLVCLCRATTQLMAAGRVATSRRLVEAVEAAAPFDRYGDNVHAWVHRMRAVQSHIATHIEGTVLGVEAALACYERAGDVRNACFMRVTLASSCVLSGEFERAEENIATASATAARIGADYLVHWGLYARGKMLTERGEVEAAREALERVIQLLPKSRRIVGGARVYLSMSALGGGDASRAELDARTALTDHDTPTVRGAAFGALARALAAQGRGAEALVAADEAAALLAQQGSLEEFECLVRLGRCEARMAVADTDGAAADALATRAWLLASAAKMTDPARRESFLSRRPLHARVIELARRFEASVAAR